MDNDHHKHPPPTETIQIGLLGCGVVGAGTLATLRANAEAIAQTVGARLVVKRILVRDLKKPRPAELPASLFTTEPAEVLDDPEIQIVAELMGGVDPARDYLQRALKNGKHVVTANKELVAKAAHDLLAEAAARRLDFSFEASVAGGIPIIRALKVSLAANRLEQVVGIVNGTTNYILTRMAEAGSRFEEALAEAQGLGYAEADPSDDVDGRDAAYKIAILASIGFQSRVDVDDVYCEGIRGIGPEDIAWARELGYVIKLVAIAKQADGALELRVHPAMLPLSHPLAAVSHAFNAIVLRGSSVGDVMFYGSGAGALPTGSSVAADLMETARSIRFNATGRIVCTCFEHRPVLPLEEVRSNYFLRVVAQDQPKVLAQIAAIFGERGVSIQSVVQKRVAEGERGEIVWITHRTREGDLRGALAEIEQLPGVRGIASWIRVEE